MTLPAISILLPSHRGTFLKETIDSALAQTRRDFELLMAYEEAPLNERLNRLAEAARGEYLVVLPDDDLIHPNFLETMLGAGNGADVIYSDVRCFDSTGFEQVARMPEWAFKGFVKGPACWLTSVVRRQLWLDVGGHEPTLDYHDWDFWYRCFRHSATARHIAMPLWSHRQHAGQWTCRVHRPAALEAIYARHPELRT